MSNRHLFRYLFRNLFSVVGVVFEGGIRYARHVGLAECSETHKHYILRKTNALYDETTN
jgi:hypothetical protein